MPTQKKHSRSIGRTVRRSSDTYCAAHDRSFLADEGCLICLNERTLVPDPDEVNTSLDVDYVIENDIDWITCPCGALRVLPITDECPLCGRDTYNIRH